MVRSIRSVLATISVLLLVLAGCAANAGDATPVATTEVDLPASYRFAPADITVASGATVTWTNRDNFTHTVQFLDGGLPAEPLHMNPGDAASFTFTTPGTFRYQCSLHPQDMRGTVLVAPAA